MPSRKHKAKVASKPNSSKDRFYSQVAFDYSQLNSRPNRTSSAAHKKSLHSPKPPICITSDAKIDKTNLYSFQECIEGLENDFDQLGFESTSNTALENQISDTVNGACCFTEDGKPVLDKSTTLEVNPTTNTLIDSSTKKGNLNKSIFPTHLTRKQMKSGLKKKALFKGILRISASNSKQAYITCDNFDVDVFILTRQYRNRAMEGDTVAFRLLESDEINAIKTSIPSSVEEFRLNIGQIVGILTRSPIEDFVGTFNEIDKKKWFITFKPADKRIPFIFIPYKELPKRLRTAHEQASGILFLARIVEWKEDKPFPLGKLIREIGPADVLANSSNAIVEQYQIRPDTFSEDIISELPKSLLLDPEDLKYRRDLRELITFTIDPRSSRDLDDAISIRVLSNELTRVWVHIADVSYFVTPGTALDKEAYERATTVYMVEKNFPMLPRVLCEDVISLRPFKDRFALSFSWTLDKEANILASSYCRSIIHSDAQLSYGQVQNILDDVEDSTMNLRPGLNSDHFKSCILELGHLSTLLRKRRFENGALELNSSKPHITLCKGQPTSIWAETKDASHSLIEELMLLANTSAAQTLKKKYPDSCIIRTHPSPKLDKLLAFKNYTDLVDHQVDTTSSETLQASFMASDGLLKDYLFHHFRRVVQRAKYICSGDSSDHLHFALNTTNYTHFTSPIRRYPDIIVHRQLIAALDDCEDHGMSQEYLNNAAEHCTVKHYSAHKAQSQSILLFLSHFLYKDIDSKPELASYEMPAIISQISDEWLEMIMPQFDFSQRVYFDQLHLSHFEVSPVSVTLYWESETSPSNSSAVSSVSVSPVVGFDEPEHFVLPEITSQKETDSTLLSSDSDPHIQILHLLDLVSVNLTVNIQTFPPTIHLHLIPPVGL